MNRSTTRDSPAEALAADGEGDAAIEHCETSLELNPDNENAVTMVERLRAPAGAGASQR